MAPSPAPHGGVHVARAASSGAVSRPSSPPSPSSGAPRRPAAPARARRYLPRVPRLSKAAGFLAPPWPRAARGSAADFAADLFARQTSTGSQAAYLERDQTIIILDWDDTICPTTWAKNEQQRLQLSSLN